LDWTPHHTPHHPTPLPTYPFQHQHYWLDPTGATHQNDGGLDAADHPLLTSVHHLPSGETTILTGTVSLNTHPWLADHQVGDTVLVPGTALLEMAVLAGRQTDCPTVHELVITTPLAVRPGTPVRLHVTVERPDADGLRPFTIHARTRSGDEWTAHATGLLADDVGVPATPAAADWPPPEAQWIDTSGFYEDLQQEGFVYGPRFQGLTALWKEGDELYAEVTLPDGATDGSAYHVHPALLDAALHPLLFVREREEPGSIWLPFQWNGFTVHATGATSLRVRISRIGGDQYRVLVTDGHGLPVAEAVSFTGRTARLSAVGASRDTSDRSLFVVGWEPVEEDLETKPGGEWLFLDPHPDP
ncbi:polyketide synthase dehydratase domain-containing protein, partial [Streptomyces sp. NPDC051105]|uniref:polyketide synthase dehydratase domain-containing protein n=1 Tax=Streptomyces sp. NPDC051105 TaxID=3154843 RepID=UPI0034129EA7